MNGRVSTDLLEKGAKRGFKLDAGTRLQLAVLLELAQLRVHRVQRLLRGLESCPQGSGVALRPRQSVSERGDGPRQLFHPVPLLRLALGLSSQLGDDLCV